MLPNCRLGHGWPPFTHDGRVSTDPDLRACPVGHGSSSILMEFLRDFAQGGSRADSRTKLRVHTEPLKVDEVDDDGAIISAETYRPPVRTTISSSDS